MGKTASYCYPPKDLKEEHNFIPISWSKTNTSKHVTALLCTRCFHRINVMELPNPDEVDQPEPEPESHSLF